MVEIGAADRHSVGDIIEEACLSDDHPCQITTMRNIYSPAPGYGLRCVVSLS
jgi:hypothetical protein